MVFNGNIKDWEDVLSRAKRKGDYFFTSENVQNPFDIQPNTCGCWKPPPASMIKVNVESSVMELAYSFGVGLVGRDSNGQVLFAEGRCYIGSVSLFVAELRSVEEGLKKAIDLGYDRLILESDAR